MKNALKLFELFLITCVRKIGKNNNGKKKQNDKKKIIKNATFLKENIIALLFRLFLCIH